MEDSKKSFKEIVSDKLADAEDFCEKHSYTIVIVANTAITLVASIVIVRSFNAYLNDLK